jgi:hypothetical protein
MGLFLEKTLDTVLLDTPAILATSSIVANTPSTSRLLPYKLDIKPVL